MPRLADEILRLIIADDDDDGDGDDDDDDDDDDADDENQNMRLAHCQDWHKTHSGLPEDGISLCNDGPRSIGITTIFWDKQPMAFCFFQCPYRSSTTVVWVAHACGPENARSMEVLNQDCWHARHMAMDHVTTVTCEKNKMG